MAMVDLEPVPEEEDLMERLHHSAGDLETKGRIDVFANMSGMDAERLHQLISNHNLFTGSMRAKQILDNWVEMLPRFVKVMPVEYRRALRGNGTHGAGGGGGGMRRHDHVNHQFRSKAMRSRRAYKGYRLPKRQSSSTKYLSRHACRNSRHRWRPFGRL
jgi:hypothetical protein